MRWASFNTLRPRQYGRHFADNIFKYIFLNENVWIPIKILLKFVPKGQNNTIPALVQIMAWRRTGDKPLSEPMMVSLPTHICVTRPQWVNWYFCKTKIYLTKKLKNWASVIPFLNSGNIMDDTPKPVSHKYWLWDVAKPMYLKNVQLVHVHH